MTRVKAESARRDEITRAAADLFEKQGFHATSMEDIAEAIGVRKATLYYHVKSKAQIVVWIHDECVASVLPPLRKHVAEGIPSADVLLYVAQDIFGLLESKSGYLRVFFEHHRELPPRERSRARKQRDEYYSLVRTAIEGGIAEGAFRKVDPSITALAYFGACNWGYQWYQPKNRLKADDVARAVWSNFLMGLTAKAERPVDPGTPKQ